MKVTRKLKTEFNLDWLQMPNRVTLIRSDELPSPDLISSALALAFQENAILLTNLKKNGWDFPGGHLEQNETSQEALEREVFEETGARLLNIRPFAYQEIELQCQKPQDYTYPYPISCQVFYLAKVNTLPDNFIETKETYGPGLFSPDKARKLLWVKRHHELYEEALKSVQI